MKNYFKFTLDPIKFLLFWLLFLFLYVVPYIGILDRFESENPTTSEAFSFLGLICCLILIVISIYYFFIKMYIESIGYKDQNIQFHGTFGRYFGKVLLGYVICIFTLGIYSPWFMADLTKYFMENSSYNSNKFKFKGDGLTLFLIISFTIIVPSFLMAGLLIFGSIYIANTDMASATPYTYSFLLIYLFMIPYIYLLYKWFVDFDFKEYHISWKTNFWKSCGKILLELFLSVITLGIYSPLASIRLYEYFVKKTEAVSPDRTLHFGYDLEQGRDFLFLWGQSLLCIITLTIYTPWAISKIGERVLGKTYVVIPEDVE